MNTDKWAIVIGVATAAVLALGPWMFMVHAKLAVIAAQIVSLGEKVQKAAEANHELWSLCAHHQARLETHDVQLGHLAERIEEL
jgi:hypothetical protein